MIIQPIKTLAEKRTAFAENIKTKENREKIGFGMSVFDSAKVKELAGKKGLKAVDFSVGAFVRNRTISYPF